MSTRARGARSAAAEAGEKSDRPQFTLVDQNGGEFTTGDLATINSALVNGYRLKDADQADVVEALVPDQGAEATP